MSLEIAMRLSRYQREYLIDHIDGIRPVIVNNNIDNMARNALLGRNLIRYVPAESISARPRGTALTELGRATLCALLGYYADQLVRAHCINDRCEIAMPLASRHEIMEIA